MQNKGLGSGKELQDLFKIEGAKDRKFFLIKVGQSYCGLLDCYLDYPKIGDVYRIGKDKPLYQGLAGREGKIKYT